MTITPPPDDPQRGAGPSGTPSWQAQPGTRPHGAHAAGAPPVGASQPATPQPGRPAPGTNLGGDIGATFSFAGSALLRNPVALLVSGAIYTLIVTVVSVIGALVMAGVIAGRASQWQNSDSIPVWELLLAYSALIPVLVIAGVIALLWQTGAVRAATIIADGGRPTLGQAMIGPGRVIATSLLVGLICAVGALLFYIPGLIAAALLLYAVPAAARGASPGAAMKQSVGLATSHLGTTVVALLILSAISMVAGFVIVGVIASIPFIGLFCVGLRERLTGRELIDPVPAGRAR